MKPAMFLTGLPLLFSLLGPAATAWGLQVTLDSGVGTQVLTDDDLDGIIDFDTTVAGVFLASGRVFEQVRSDTTIVSLTTTPPDAEAVFRNVGALNATFSIVIDSSTFPVIGPPLGWSVFYSGRTADSLAGPVNVSSHSVDASANAGAIPLTTLNGLPSVAAEDFALSTSGVNAADNGTAVRVVYTFTLDPNNEIYLPDNNGTDGDAIQVSVFNQQAKCVDKMNNLARKVLNAAQKSDARCVKEGVKAGGADETVCVDDAAEGKTEKAEAKLIEAFDATCAANLPPWGVNGDTCCEGGASDGDSCLVDAGCPGGACVRGACMSDAAEQAANAMTHDLFGASVVVTDGDAIGKCQSDVSKRAGKLLVERWKTLRSCKKDNFATIMDDVDLVTTCLGSPQSDPKGRIGKAVTKLGDSIAKCIDKGVTPVGPSFAGQCTGSADGTIAACMSAAIACEFCQAVNVADDIVPAVDCDQFDDAAVNASCP